MLRSRARARKVEWAAGALGIACALATQACGFTTRAPTQTAVTDTWKEPAHTPAPLSRVIVVGEGMNATDRRTVEDGLVRALGAHGVTAMPSYEIQPRELPTVEAAQAALGRQGDGLLVANLRGTTDRVTYPAWDGALFQSETSNRGHYAPSWNQPAKPTDTIATDQYVKVETSIVDPRESGRIVWSTVTQTGAPRSATDLAASLSKAVMPELTKAGFVPPPEPGARRTSSAQVGPTAQ